MHHTDIEDVNEGDDVDGCAKKNFGGEFGFHSCQYGRLQPVSTSESETWRERILSDVKQVEWWDQQTIY